MCSHPAKTDRPLSAPAQPGAGMALSHWWRGREFPPGLCLLPGPAPLIGRQADTADTGHMAASHWLERSSLETVTCVIFACDFSRVQLYSAVQCTLGAFGAPKK